METFDKKKYNSRVGKWKARGLVGDYNKIYNIYLTAEKCEKCHVNLTLGQRTITTKTMNHNHETGEFINILCHRCNIKENKRNTSGINGLSYNSLKDIWRYRVYHKQLFSHKDKEVVIAFINIAEERLQLK
mgnify:CR=1 FL=1